MENLEKWGKTQGRGIEDLASEKNWRNGRKFLGRVEARMGAQQGVRDCESRGSGGGGGRGRNGVVEGPRGIEQRLDEISGIIKST